jgi:hypothetical protein
MDDKSHLAFILVWIDVVGIQIVRNSNVPEFKSPGFSKIPHLKTWLVQYLDPHCRVKLFRLVEV